MSVIVQGMLPSSQDRSANDAPFRWSMETEPLFVARAQFGLISIVASQVGCWDRLFIIGQSSPTCDLLQVIARPTCSTNLNMSIGCLEHSGARNAVAC